MEVPEKPDMEFLIRNQDNQEWASYVMSHPESVLALYADGDYPQACQHLVQTLRSLTHSGKDPTVRHDCFVLSSRIASAGLEWMDQLRDGGLPVSDMPGFGMDYGNLCMLRGTVMNSLNRPFEAIRMFEEADRHYAAFAESLDSEDGCTNDIIDDVMDRSVLCNIRIAESWYRYSTRLPDSARRIQLTFVTSYLQGAYDYYREKDDRKGMEFAESLYIGPARTLEEMGGIDVQRITEIDRSEYGDDYRGWVGRNRLFMNLASEIPRGFEEWMNDNINFQPDDRCSMILADAFLSFDHCRDALYEFYLLDDHTRYWEGRSLDVELLIDAYLRLLSVFNKVRKVAESMNHASDSDSDFRNVSRSLRFSTNRYIRAIADLIDDLFPRYAGEDVSAYTPDFIVASTLYGNSFFCDAVIQGAVNVTSPEEQPFLDRDMVSVSPDYIERQVLRLMRGIREIVLLMQLAQYE